MKEVGLLMTKSCQEWLTAFVCEGEEKVTERGIVEASSEQRKPKQCQQNRDSETTSGRWAGEH